MKPRRVPLAAIHCAHSLVRRLSALKPHPKNPNTHPPKQLEALGKIILKAGWRAPIVVSRRSGFIIKGHGRRLAAIAVGLKEAPVDFQNYRSAEEEMADMIADNHLAEMAEMDLDQLSENLEELRAAGTDLDLTGFSESQIKVPRPASTAAEVPKHLYELIIECKSESQQVRLLARLSREGLTCRALTF